MNKRVKIPEEGRRAWWCEGEKMFHYRKVIKFAVSRKGFTRHEKRTQTLEELVLYGYKVM